MKTLLQNARCIVTCDDNDSILRGADVLMEDGVISAIGHLGAVQVLGLRRQNIVPEQPPVPPERDAPGTSPRLWRNHVMVEVKRDAGTSIRSCDDRRP